VRGYLFRNEESYLHFFSRDVVCVFVSLEPARDIPVLHVETEVTARLTFDGTAPISVYTARKTPTPPHPFMKHDKAITDSHTMIRL